MALWGALGAPLGGKKGSLGALGAPLGGQNGPRGTLKETKVDQKCGRASEGKCQESLMFYNDLEVRSGQVRSSKVT